MTSRCIMISLWAQSILIAQTTPPQAPESVAQPLNRFAHLSATPYPEGVTDEQGYAARLSQQGQDLFTRCDAIKELQSRLIHRIAATNWVLADQCEPFMSRYLHRISLDSDPQRMAQMIRRCLDELGTAREELEQYVALPEPDEAAADEYREAIDLLEAFAEALGACFLDQSQAEVSPGRPAARRMSRYLEDRRPDVAAAALLWQAAVYGQDGRVDRALRILPHATETPDTLNLHYDFFARLLRCRYLVQQERYTAAWTLLLLIEEKSNEWFTGTRDRADAARSAVLRKIALCDAWSAALDESTQQEVITWCRTRRSDMIEEHFASDGQGALSRLIAAMPIIVDFPDPSAKETPNDSQSSDDQTPQNDPEVQSDSPDQTELDSTP